MAGGEILQILCLDGTDTLVIRKSKNSRFFLTTPDSIIISKRGLIMLINMMTKRGYLHSEIFEGILEEVHTK